MRVGSAALVSLAFALAAGLCRAEPRIALDYEAAAGCPSRAELAQAIEARKVKVDPSASASAEVRIVREGLSHKGTIVFRPGGTRVLGDHSCAELAAALAVVIAVTAADLDAPPASPPPPHPPLPPAPPPPEEPPPSTSAQLSLGASFAVATHVAPRLAVGGLAFVELGPTRRGVLAPSFRLSAAALSAGAVDVPANSQTPAASFTAVGARFDFRALRFELASVELHLGATAGVLAVRAEGLGVRDARTVWAPFVDVGPFVRGHFVVGPLAVELGIALLATITRPRYTFAPSTTVFEAPPVGALFFASIGFDRNF